MNRRDGVECTPFGAPFPSPRRTPPRFPRSRIPDPGSGIHEPPCGLVEVQAHALHTQTIVHGVPPPHRPIRFMITSFAMHVGSARRGDEYVFFLHAL